MGRGGQVGAVALVLGIVGVMAYFGLRPSVFPNVPVSVDATETSSIDQLRGVKKKLVLALLIPGDPVSAQVVEMLKAEQPAAEARAAFAGLFFGDLAALDQFRAAHDVPYPLVSITPQTNPVQYNEVVKAVGGASSRFYGGTVVVLDGARKIVKQVNGNEAEHLAEALKGL